MARMPCTPCAATMAMKPITFSLAKIATAGIPLKGLVARFGKKSQRRTSPKLLRVCALIMTAPMTPARIKAYIASAETRVKSHMMVSKLIPRFERGRVRFAVVILHSEGRANDDDHGHN